MKKQRFLIVLVLASALALNGCNAIKPSTTLQEKEIGLGWSANSVNTVIFRQNAVTTFNTTQFTAYYDKDAHVVLAKRSLPDGDWELNKTEYTGKTTDAHNAISLAVDGEGYLHVSWDHHDNPLRYAKSVAPLSLELGEKQEMTGIEEEKVSYPQFYNLPDGDVLFMYRSGQSGRGTLILNRYDTAHKTWRQLHNNLIDGEEQRNAYWQAYVDVQGTVHLSWVWRETWDVSTNHDIAYARSLDGGETWERATGKIYNGPITESTAEYAYRIPQNSSLINQTSMTTDKAGNPFIANYWNEEGKTQYQVVYLEDGIWKKENTAFRNSGFELGGGGTKKIPISRPELFIYENQGEKILGLIFRDDLRGSKISLVFKDLKTDTQWQVKDLSDENIGDWEPNFDKELYKHTKALHLFKQKVTQIDGEGLSKAPATPVSILEINLQNILTNPK